VRAEVGKFTRTSRMMNLHIPLLLCLLMLHCMHADDAVRGSNSINVRHIRRWAAATPSYEASASKATIESIMSSISTTPSNLRPTNNSSTTMSAFNKSSATPLPTSEPSVMPTTRATAKPSAASTLMPTQPIPIQYIRCRSLMGLLAHYYHFLANCLLPSVLYYQKHAYDLNHVRRFALCDTNLTFENLDMTSAYRAALPSIEIVPPTEAKICLHAGSAKDPVITLSGYDDRHGSGFMRMTPEERSLISSYFVKQSPQEYRPKKEYRDMIIILGRAANHSGSTLSGGGKTGAERRSISNFDALYEAVRSEFGKPGSRTKVIAAYPEKMSIFEQFWLFQRARIVIGQHGAGLSNIFFTKPGKFIGLIEISPYTYNRRGEIYRAFADCFQLLAESLDTQYYRVRQAGEFGSANVTETVEAIKLMESQKFMVGPLKHQLHLVRAENHSLTLNDKLLAYNKAIDRTRPPMVDYHGHSDIFGSLRVRDQMNQLECVQDRDSNDMSDFYFKCLFPSILFVTHHPNIHRIYLCGVHQPYQEAELAQLIPRFVAADGKCHVNAIRLQSLGYVNSGKTLLPENNTADGLSRNDTTSSGAGALAMTPKQHSWLMTFFMQKLARRAQVSNPGSIGVIANIKRVVLVDSNRDDFPEYFPLPRQNLVELEEAVKVYCNQTKNASVTTIKLYDLSVEDRASYFNSADVLVVHMGPALINALFLGQHTRIVLLVPPSPTPANAVFEASLYNTSNTTNILSRSPQTTEQPPVRAASLAAESSGSLKMMKPKAYSFLKARYNDTLLKFSSPQVLQIEQEASTGCVISSSVVEAVKFLLRP
jgi:hypothetical protein